MVRRFAKAVRIALRDDGFAQILSAGVLLVVIGTVVYTTSQDWSWTNGFYFAIATLTTSSIADPSLTLSGGGIEIFTVFYILVGIGILVELARQVGMAFIEVRKEEKAAKQAKHGAKAQAEPGKQGD